MQSQIRSPKREMPWMTAGAECGKGATRRQEKGELSELCSRGRSRRGRSRGRRASTQAPPTGRAPAPAAVSHGHSLPRTALGAVQPSLLESSKRLTATAGAGGW